MQTLNKTLNDILKIKILNKNKCIQCFVQLFLFNILYLSEIEFLHKNIECNSIFKVKCYIQYFDFYLKTLFSVCFNLK